MTLYVLQILAGLAAGAILFLVASGLTLIFGALRIVNFAHGSFYMVGAYIATSIAAWLRGGNLGFWLALLLASLFVMLLGAVIEVTIFRRIYRHSPLTQLLTTFALVLIIGGINRYVYGVDPRLTTQPPMFSGSIPVAGGRFPVYQVFLVGLAVVVAGALWFMLQRTELGRVIRAAVSDPQLLELSGVNVPWVFTGVFALGAFLAGLAGAAVGPVGVLTHTSTSPW